MIVVFYQSDYQIFKQKVAKLSDAGIELSIQ